MTKSIHQHEVTGNFCPTGAPALHHWHMECGKRSVTPSSMEGQQVHDKGCCRHGIQNATEMEWVPNSRGAAAANLVEPLASAAPCF